MNVAIDHSQTPVPPWVALRCELDAWARAGRTATFWWRDDDATRPAAALDRLLALRRGLPLAIAAIPAWTDGRLADRLAAEPDVGVIQHGFVHRNRAPRGARKCELAGGEPLAATLRRLAWGRRRLAGLFGRRFVPVLAPPWNRIDCGVARALRRAGLHALSCHGAPQPVLPTPQINTHLDPIDWRGTRGFIGEAAALDALASHLRRRRTGAAPNLPSGLLTHHRDNDAAVWQFLAALVEFTRSHPAARWISIKELL